MQDEPEDLERDHAEQRFVARFAEDHGRVAFALWEPDVALGHVAFDLGAVGEDERHPAARRQPDRAPVVGRQEAVLGAAVDEKRDRASDARRSRHHALDVRESHRCGHSNDPRDSPRVQGPIPSIDPVDRLTRGVRARRLAPREACRDRSSPARKETRMIYEVRTYRIAPRSLPEVEKRFGEAYEYRKKYSELFAFWHTEIGSLNEIVH